MMLQKKKNDYVPADVFKNNNNNNKRVRLSYIQFNVIYGQHANIY